VNPVQLARRVGDVFDHFGVRWVLGGSLAMSLTAEPRSTLDVDMVAELDRSHIDHIMNAFAEDFFVQREAVAEALEDRRSFNLLSLSTAWKVDVFVSGNTQLDQWQLDRRRLFVSDEVELWLPSAADQVLRKLWRFRLGHEVSERQWRDVVGLLVVCEATINRAILKQNAIAVGVDDLLDRALADAGE
jgi:hypothetical protein